RAGNFAVTKTGDSERGACSPGDCSLREAIEAANAAGTSTISLPAGTYVLTIAKTLTLSADITITGAGSTTTIVDANHLVRVFDTPLNNMVEIDGVTIRRGSDVSGVGGGGIHNAGTFTGIDLVLDGNTSNGKGGGVFNESTAYFVQSVLRNNMAATGGGFANT